MERLLGVETGVDAKRVLRLVAESGALLRGHFGLQSGAHSSYFLRFRAIGWEPELLEDVVELLVERAELREARVNVLCAESAAFALAQRVAETTTNSLVVVALDRRRRPTKELRSGAVVQGAPSVIVSDILTTGESLRPLVELAPPPAEVLAFASRLSQPPPEGVTRVTALVRPLWESVAKENCDMCRAEAPLIPAAELN
ncbi:MAG: hypothetical protein RLO52_40875 [Sandaracinaceae bacterium]